MIDQNIYTDPDGRRYMIGADGSKNYERGAPVPNQSPLSSLAGIAPALTEPLVDNALKQTVGDSLSLSGIGSAGNYIAPGLGVLGAYDLLTNNRGKAGGALQGAASGAAIGSFFPGAGTAIGAGVGGLVGLAKGFFDRKSTKEQVQERWGKLAESAPGSKAQISELYKSAHASGDKGEKWTPEVAAAAIKDPTSIWGQYGMLNTFGDDYFSKMDEFQRYAASQAAIDNGLVKNRKGDIIITDPTKLKSLTESAYKNADYRKAYDAWKKTEKSPKASLSSISPNAEVAAANIMAGAQKQIANQSAQQTKQQSLLGLLSQNTGQPRRVADYGAFSGARNPYL